MRKQKGFSLIELLIVVAIILIIAAIAIPNLLRSRMAANEASAVGSVRALNTAQVTYASTYPNVGFANALASLGGADPCTPANACLVDDTIALSNVTAKSGYLNTMAGFSGTVPEVTYTVNADPVTRGQTGQRSFFSDQSGVIRFNATAAAALTDPPIQ